MATIAVVDTDFDGLTCGWLFKKFIPDVMLLSWWGRDLSDVKSFDSKISSGDFVYFADKCPKPEYLQGLLDKGVNFRVLDHHATSRNEIAKYDADNGTNLMSRCIFEEGKKVTDPNTGKELERTMDAALVLVWNFLTDSYPLPPALKYLSAFDTFRFWSEKDADKLRAEWGSQVYSKNAEGKFSTGENINKILSKYLDIKMEETPGDELVNKDGVSLNKIDFKSIDLNTDNFIENAKEDFEAGSNKFEENKNMCKEVASKLLVLNLGGVDVLTVDIAKRPELQGKRSDIGGYIASLSPEGVGGIIMTEKDPRIMKISMRVKGLTGDDDMPKHSVAKIANNYFYVTRNKKTGELNLDASGEPQRSYGGGHDEAAGIMVNVNEEDRVFPGQVLFSDIMAASRQATEADIVCDISTKTSSLKLSSRDGFNVNIENKTLKNKNYRQVLFTAPQIQLVTMSIKPGDEIGMESHPDTAQFIRIEQGKGRAVINGKNIPLKDGTSVIVPAKTKHNIINTGKEDLKLYTIYTSPQHKDKAVYKTKEIADKMEKESSIKLSSRDAVEDTIKYWDKAKNKDFSKYYRLLKKNKKKANYIPNPKSTMQNPIKKNYDYGESPNWIDRVKNRQKSRKKRKGSINSILK